MGLFKKKPKEPSEIERLKGEIVSMAARLDAVDAAKRQLGDQVQGLTNRIDRPPEPPPAPPPEPTVSTDEFRALVSRMSDLSSRLNSSANAEVVTPAELEAVSTLVHTNTERLGQLEDMSARVHTLADRLEEVDARITAISNELANQLTELSGDIEALNGSGPASDLFDQLRDTQIKLANEQARYQIAFRQDLAHLADFLKHS